MGNEENGAAINQEEGIAGDSAAEHGTDHPHRWWAAGEGYAVGNVEVDTGPGADTTIMLEYPARIH